MKLRVAIPLFGIEVAPRFCFTSRMLVASIDEEHQVEKRILQVDGLRWSERIEALVENDVKVLLCGGFNRRFLPYARQLGIEVLWGNVGPADELLERFIRSLNDEWRSESFPATLPVDHKNGNTKRGRDCRSRQRHTRGWRTKPR